MAGPPKRPEAFEPAPPRREISGSMEIGADVPMEPLVSGEGLGLFTPAALQRAQARDGGAVLFSPGDSGPSVVELQRELRALGLLNDDLGAEEGHYGPLTETALRTFQEANGHKPTGSCDVRTRGLVREAARARGT